VVISCFSLDISLFVGLVSTGIIPWSFFRTEGRSYGKLSSLSQKLSQKFIILNNNNYYDQWKNILIIDDDVETSLKYQKWLEAEQEEEEGFNLTLINDPELTEQNFKTGNYDLVPIGFRMSM